MTEILRIGNLSIEEFFDEVILEVGSLEIELDDNPLEMGPSAVNEKIAKCRRFINRCEKYALMISAAEARVNRQLRLTQGEYDLRYNDLYANDPRIRAGRSEKEREALINTRLLDLVQELEDIKAAAAELKQLAVIIKTTRSSLKDTSARIKDQITMCQEDIKLGSQWGSASILDMDMPPPTEGQGETVKIMRHNSIKVPPSNLLDFLDDEEVEDDEEDLDEEDNSNQTKVADENTQPDFEDILKNI